NRLGRRLCSARGLWARAQDHVDVASDQLRGEVRQQLAVPGGRSVLNDDVATFVISDLAQALQKGLTLGRWLLRQGRQQEIPEASDFPCPLPLDGQRRDHEVQSYRAQEHSSVHQSSLGEYRSSIRRMSTSWGMAGGESSRPELIDAGPSPMMPKHLTTAD